MGQGSRGGNGGLSASGERVRRDKEAAREPKKVAKAPGNKPGERKPGEKKPGEGGKGGKGGEGGKGGRGRGGLRSIPHPHGHGGLGRLLGHLHAHPGSTGSKSGKGKTAAKKHTVSTHVPKPKQPKMPKLKAPREKLTKQRTNKTPN